MGQQIDKPIEKWKRDELIDTFRKYKEEIESTQASVEKIKGFVDEHGQILEDLPAKLGEAQQHSAEIEELKQTTVGMKQEMEEIKEDVENKQEGVRIFYSDLLEGEEATEETPHRVPSIKRANTNLSEKF